jgi:hypothetical protein
MAFSFAVIRDRSTLILLAVLRLYVWVIIGRPVVRICNFYLKRFPYDECVTECEVKHTRTLWSIVENEDTSCINLMQY